MYLLHNTIINRYQRAREGSGFRYGIKKSGDGVGTGGPRGTGDGSGNYGTADGDGYMDNQERESDPLDFAHLVCITAARGLLNS